MTQRTHANDDEPRHQPNDAIALLTADHRQVRALFQQYEATSDPYLKQVIAEHVFAEQADEAGKGLVSEALQDHQQLRERMATLQETDEAAAFETRFHALRDYVEQYVEDEETMMFPQAAQVLAAHLEEITLLLQERKAQILAS